MIGPSAFRHARPPRFPVERWHLANGLRVVVQPDARWPLVAATMCYEAGSRSDPPTRSGLAHLCEHLAFDGPASASGKTRPARVESLGGASQAATTPDRLSFTSVFPRAELGAVLAMEAERMACPFDPRDVDALEIQRRVLVEELHQRSTTRLRAAALEQLHRLLFPAEHPYHRPPAGEPGGIRAIAPDDVRAFYASHFTPRNAVLVLAGDVTVEAAAAGVGRAFDALAGGTERVRRIASSEQPPTVRSLRLPTGVSTVHAHVAWAVPGLGQKDWHLAALLLRALAVGRSSPLVRKLVDRTGLADDVRGHLVTMRDASTLMFVASGARGVESRRLEEALIEAADRLLSSPLPARMLERARRKALSDHYLVVQSLDRRADLCASLCSYLDAPERLDEEPQRYSSPDVDAMAAFAAKVRLQPARAMLSLVPRVEAA